jgi:hypothetical protein
VIFNRRDNTNLNQHRDSFSNVASKPGLGKEVERLISVVQNEGTPKPPSGKGKPDSGPSGGPSDGGSRPPRPNVPGAPSRPTVPGAPSRPTVPGGSSPGGPGVPRRY